MDSPRSQATAFPFPPFRTDGQKGVTAMRPISFSCTENLPLAPEEIAGQILNLANWTDFKGYGILPGIKAAEFEIRTPDVIGSRIRVMNTDGSTHVEEIIEWRPDHHLRLDLKEFSPPLSHLATGFTEWWEFERIGGSTRVTRSFELHAQSVLTRPLLWQISFLLKRAIARHLSEMREAPTYRGN